MTKQQHIEELQDKLRSQIQQAEDTLWHLRKQLSRLNGIAADEPVLTDEMATLTLTEKHVWVLERMVKGLMQTGGFKYYSHKNELYDCRDYGYAIEDVGEDDNNVIAYPFWHITEAGRAALKAHQASAATTSPRCVSCGKTNNLTEVIATPDGIYHLCPEHLAEEDIA